MNGPSFMDDICGDFFDHIDDILDFPTENVEDGVTGDCYDSFPPIWSAPQDSLGSSSVFSTDSSSNNASELTTELSVPYEDIAQLEWLSNFVEDSFSNRAISIDKESNSDSKSHHFQTSSPVSVLESNNSSCPEGKKTLPLGPKTFIPGRARSKRPRPATFNPRPMIPLVSPTSSVIENNQSFSSSELSSDMENFGESHPPKRVLQQLHASEQKKKKKKKKLSPLPPGATMEMEEQYPSPHPIAVRKCLHCEITKTPQWRAGPMGSKTLCNACGVRYKSGRLFPEYRPAASPTFVTSVHSNSHKKVIEMRNKACQNTTALDVTATTPPPPPELVPNIHVLLDNI